MVLCNFQHLKLLWGGMAVLLPPVLGNMTEFVLCCIIQGAKFSSTVIDFLP